MRRHKILIGTFLILSTINLALAAPVAVRERPEVCLDAKAKATRGVTVASQKRGPLDESGSTNIPGLEHGLPPSPDSADVWSQIAYIDNPLPTPDSLGSLLRSGHVPPNPEFPRLTEGSIPVAGPPSPPPESWSPNTLGSAPPPPPPAASLHLTDTFSQIAEQHRYTDNPLPPMDGPESLAGAQLPVESMPEASSLPLLHLLESWSVPGSDHAPLLSPAGVLSHIAAQYGYTTPQPPPDTSLGSSIGSRLPVGGSHFLSPPLESWSSDVPGSDYAPLPNTGLIHTFSQTAEQMPEQHEYTDLRLPQDNLGSSTGPRFPVGGSHFLSPPLESWSLDMPGSDYAPLPDTSLAHTFSQTEEQMLEHHEYSDSLRLPPDNPGSPTELRLPVGGPHSLSLPLESWSPDVPGSNYAPLPNTGLTHTFSQTAEQMSEQHEYSDSLRIPPDNLGSSTGSHLSVGSMPVTSSHFLSPPLESWSPEVELGSDYTPPPSPDLTDMLLQLAEQMSEHHGYADGPQPPPDNHFPSPPGSSVNPDTLSSVGSTGDPTLTPPQSPGVDPEIHSLIEPESFPGEFWESFLKGKIKRHISDSGAVNLG